MMDITLSQQSDILRVLERLPSRSLLGQNPTHDQERQYVYQSLWTRFFEEVLKIETGRNHGIHHAPSPWLQDLKSNHPDVYSVVKKEVKYSLCFLRLITTVFPSIKEHIPGAESPMALYLGYLVEKHGEHIKFRQRTTWLSIESLKKQLQEVKKIQEKDPKTWTMMERKVVEKMPLKYYQSLGRNSSPKDLEFYNLVLHIATTQAKKDRDVCDELDAFLRAEKEFTAAESRLLKKEGIKGESWVSGQRKRGSRKGGCYR